MKIPLSSKFIIIFSSPPEHAIFKLVDEKKWKVNHSIKVSKIQTVNMIFRRLRNHTAMVSRLIQVWILIICINFVPSISSRLSSTTDDVNESFIFIPYNVRTIKMATYNNRTLRRKRLLPTPVI